MKEESIEGGRKGGREGEREGGGGEGSKGDQLSIYNTQCMVSEMVCDTLFIFFIMLYILQCLCFHSTGVH